MKRGIMRMKTSMKSVKLMKFTKSVKKKILKSLPKAQENGKGKPATGKMATRRKKTQAHEEDQCGKSMKKNIMPTKKSMKFLKSVKKRS